MRYLFSLVLMLVLPFGFAAAQPLQLSDPGLPLQELRPLDRRVHILTLEGAWYRAAAAEPHYVNFVFPNGGGYDHRVLDPDLFRRGEVRCVIQDYQLVRHGQMRNGKFTITISAKAPLAEGGEAVSNALSVTWPMDRAVSKYRPRSKYADPDPVDAFSIPGAPKPLETTPPPRKVKDAPKSGE